MSARRVKIPEAYRALARTAREVRWTIARYGSGHLRWQSPAGAVVTTAATPGDRRTVLNDRARLRRAGLTLETPWTST